MRKLEELAGLMNVVEQCAKHGSAFPNIQSMAMLELQEAERQLGEEVEKRKEAYRQRDARERAEKERGGRNETPAPSAAFEPPQTQVRSPNEPILQRPDPNRSIPNEGPTGMQSAANVRPTEDAAGHGSRVSTQNTRDIAMGERHPNDQALREEEDRRRRLDAERRRATEGQPDVSAPVPEVDRRV